MRARHVSWAAEGARCAVHKDHAKLPATCGTCQRIRVERLIVRHAVRALRKAGFTLGVDYGDGYQTSATEAGLLAMLFDVDDCYLIVRDRSGASQGWVRFVFGNDGWDVISDYTTNLETQLQATNDYAARFES